MRQESQEVWKREPEEIEEVKEGEVIANRRTARDTAPIAAFILAGGESSRMRVDKGLLEIDGVPLIVRTARLVDALAGAATVVGRPERYQPVGLRAIADDWPGCGPLGGIATALRASDRLWNLIVACDLPYLTRGWLEFLVRRALESHADAVVPMNEHGAEPLCAMYHSRCEPAVRGALEEGMRKVTGGLSRIGVEYLEPAGWKCFDSDGLLFKNMNTPADYKEAQTRLAVRAKS
jgi:molybdopterin-guanine dinucleotide biosynthesis protein A